MREFYLVYWQIVQLIAAELPALGIDVENPQKPSADSQTKEGMKMTGKMDKEYFIFVHEVAALIESARRAAAKSVNNIMTATYWFIGRRIVEQEQSGDVRAQYGEGLLARLAQDLSSRFGRGFSPDNLETMRMFYRAFPPGKISETLSRKRIRRGAAEKIRDAVSEI